jgi:ferredoxin
MLKIDRSACDECGTCISICPFDALVFNPGLKVDDAKCVSCGKCVRICPFGALSLAAEMSSANPSGCPETETV